MKVVGIDKTKLSRNFISPKIGGYFYLLSVSSPAIFFSDFDMSKKSKITKITSMGGLSGELSIAGLGSKNNLRSKYRGSNAGATAVHASLEKRSSADTVL